MPISADAIDSLTDYAVPLRYDDPLDAEELDRAEALRVVGELRAWAETLIGESA